MLATLGRYAREKVLELSAAVLALAFLVSKRVSPRAALHAIDVDLLLVLFALLVTVEILRASGWLDFIVVKTVARFRSPRAFTLAMIVFSGALAALVTNDVTLFVVIPFTILASRVSDFDVERAVILEIVASNLLGCLTPLGNPQNLFVFHRAGWSAAQFVMTMAPFVAWCAGGFILALLWERRAPAPAGFSRDLGGRGRPPLQRSLAIAGAACFLLVLLEVARVIHAWPAALAALFCGVFFLRRRMLTIDFSIIPLFFCAFIVVEGLRSFALPFHTNVYATSIVLSQFISNVPAVVLLTPFAHGDWRALLYGVNAGGCGTIIASLANLLGWRIYVRESNREPRFFRRLTAINFAFLAWAAIGGWLLLL